MEKCSSPSSSSAATDSVNGLKFGKKIYFEVMGPGWQPKTGQPAPSSPAKKGRTGAVEPPRCQVEGCNVDLSDAKAYYSRHKVCGMHSKSPKVTVAGIEQRFCQQCSRFHQLPEFDQGKRSCRRRLADHNERRRKPSPGSLLSPRHGSISPSMFDSHSQTSSLAMNFSTSSTFTGRTSWTYASLENQAAIAGKPQLSWLSRAQIPGSDLLQGTSTRPRYSGPEVPSEECFNGVSDSSSALSLLSNDPWRSKNRSSCFEESHFLATGDASSVQPSINTGTAISHFTCPAWALHKLPPELGLGQASYPVSSQHAGELGLAQPGDAQLHQVDQSRGYSSSIHHIHWPL